MACYTQLTPGGKWYNPDRMKRLENLIDSRDKADPEDVKSIDKEINLELSRGIPSHRDANGDIQVSDIFDDTGLDSSDGGMSRKDKILTKLKLKATGLSVSNESGALPESEVWDAYKNIFQKEGISQKEVAESLKSFNDPDGSTIGDIIEPDTAGKVKNFFKTTWFANLGKRGLLALFPELQERAILREPAIQNRITRATRNLNRLNTIRSTKEGKKITQAQNNNIVEALQGKATFKGTGISPRVDALVKGLIEDIRLDLDLLSSELQRFGGKSYDTIDIIENNKGEYVTRTYEVFTNPKWVEKLFNSKTGDPTILGDKLLSAARPLIRKNIDNLLDRERSFLKAKKKELKELQDSDQRRDAAAVEKEIARIEQRITGLEVSKSSDSSLNSYIKQQLESFSDKGRVRDVKILEQTGKTQNTIFKRRNEDLPEEIRALWGETSNSEDPYKAIVNSVIRMSTQLENSIFQTAVADIMNKDGLITTDKAEATKRGWKEIPITNQGYNVLADALGLSSGDRAVIYAPEAIADMLSSTVEQLSARKNNPISDAIGFLSGILKKNMTVWNFSGQSVNVLGGVSFAAASGKLGGNYASKIGTSSGILLNKAFGFGELTPQEREIVDIMEANGLLSSSLEVDNLKKLLDSKQVERIKEIMETNKLGRAALATDEILTNLYEMGDGLWKANDLQVRLDEYAQILGGKKSFFDISDPQTKTRIIELAAKETRNEFPNYNETWEFINNIRRSKLLGAFPSFPAEAVRTRLATINRQVNHIKGQDLPDWITDDQKKKIRRKAIGELTANVVISHGLALALPTLITQLVGGFSDEEEKAVRDKLLLPWERNGILVKDDNNPSGYTVYQTGYYLPTGYITELLEPIIRSVTGQSDVSITKAMQTSVIALVEPYMGLDIVSGLAFSFFANDKGFGGEIVSTDDFNASFKEVLTFTAKKSGGLVGQAFRIHDYNKALGEAKLALDEADPSDPNYEKLKQRHDLFYKKAISKGDLSKGTSGLGYNVGLRHNAHNVNQDISYALMTEARGLMKAKRIFTALTHNFETDKSVLDKNFNYTEKEYHKELEKVKKTVDIFKKTMPDLDLDGIYNGEYKFNRTSKDDTKKIFSKKEKAYINGEVDFPPELKLTTFTNRSK